MVNQRNACTVVPSVLEPFQPFYQDGVSLALSPDISNYSTHILNTILIFKKREYPYILLVSQQF